MSWRREIEALVRPPSETPAVFVSLDRGTPTSRVVHAGAAFFDEIAPRADATRARAAAARDALLVAGMRSPALPFPDASSVWVVVSFLGDASEPHRRALLLAEIARIATPRATLVAVDHNRPRRLAPAFTALIRPPRPPRWLPLAAWRRLAYPTARELRMAGFTVDRLRLVAGERVQVISARRDPHC